MGIDASRYSHESATGVEWYSYHIINGILEQAKNDEIVLYARSELKLPFVKIINKKRFWTLIGLSNELKKNPPDVLFVPSHVLPFHLPKRCVTTIHDVAFRNVRNSYGFLQYYYLNWSTKRAVKKADKIIVPSEATASDLIKFFKCPQDKIEIIPHGYEKPKVVDDEIFNQSPVFQYFKIDTSMKYLLFIGRLESKKNLVRMVEAFAVFASKNPEYKLILAGKRGYGFKNVLKKVQKLKLMHKVIMPGYITEEEKAALYKYCQAFVFISLYEGFGLPILEAFSYGRPVLSSNVSSLPEVGGEVAYYVDPHSVNSISEGMEKVIKMENNKGRERCAEFSWERAVKQTLGVIRGSI